ncbi:glutamyl-tRNA synthetase, glutamate--tRNA(Gln) ligase [Thalassoporum mexicanum PCC 7367]|uniref:glutamate--tRNA ligase n=1 Tax=Thalassoporum mexicanum TaxID=3457544 RepID=UPI00029FACA3|nr:glutamate--tRNA ligase [Pseudanabaena sp. PCC 7367]AFY68739.1 glutamyl-tRNA synthetase, glutamate--tRNA(Gln) ligase [Pseudanabaena sp. PCC 7367]
MTVRVRIAPSPTGNLHIGTARTAMFNWLYARRHGGKFVLRIEDTDKQRSRPEYTENILKGLEWLGLDYDEGPIYQSDRFDRHVEMVQLLLDRGLAYYCYTSAAELEQMRQEQAAKKQAPRYDNRHRNLTQAQRDQFAAQGRIPVIRFIIQEPREIVWTDLVRGKVTWNSRDLGGDMVIAKVDETGAISQALYNFAVVVDDLDMEISQVIRGEDHIANTAKQILLYEAFDRQPPEFGHTPLILNAQGAKISKRDGATSVDEFRAMGYVPEAFNNYMVLLGWSPADAKEIFSLDEAAQVFDFDRVNKAGARFDWDKLNWINSQYLHHMDIGDLCDRLVPVWQAAGYDLEQPGIDRDWLMALVEIIAPSLTRLNDAIQMTSFFFTSSLTYTDEAKGVLEPDEVRGILQDLLTELKAASTLDQESVNGILKSVTKAKGVKKGKAMRPLRAAITGDVHGPDLIPSLLLLAQRDVLVNRLAAAIAL